MSELLPRMRIRRGRVMHRVKTWGKDGYQSLCRTADGGMPRAFGYHDLWETERYWYPDCQRCPEDET